MLTEPFPLIGPFIGFRDLIYYTFHCIFLIMKPNWFRSRGDSLYIAFRVRRAL